jgi:hypothetical protein
LGLQHVPDEDETPIASTGGMEAGETMPAPPLRGAPASGTGGLY